MNGLSPTARGDCDGPRCLRTCCAQGIAGRALVISAGIIANIIFAYSILLAQVLPGQRCVGLPDAVLWPVIAMLPGLRAPLCRRYRCRLCASALPALLYKAA